DNAGGSPQQVTLSGTATSVSLLQVSPGSVSFSSQSEGTSSPAQMVTVTNNGSAAANLTGVSMTGATDFTIANPCSVLAAGKSCQVGVTFSPKVAVAPGNRSASLNVPGGAPAAISLTGVATQAGILLPTNFNFGSQLAGTSGNPQPFAVTNNTARPFSAALHITTTTSPNH